MFRAVSFSRGHENDGGAFEVVASHRTQKGQSITALAKLGEEGCVCQFVL